MEMPNIHIGDMIRGELERQERSVTWLAEQLNMQRPNCYRLLRSQSIPTDQLRQISIIMEHDFFADCASLESKGKEMAPTKTGVEIMTEFERKVLHRRMDFVEKLENGCNHYSFFYEEGYIDCAADTTNNYIEFLLRYAEDLPYTHELYTAALLICNQLNNEYRDYKFLAIIDKEKIYFEVSNESYGFTDMEQLVHQLEGLFVMASHVREEVENLREKIIQYPKYPLTLFEYVKHQ